jgi:spermidine/putrescine transport system substrate-binding protein
LRNHKKERIQKRSEKMKKSIIFILILLTLVGCGKEDQKNELYLFNWSDYIPDEVITDFEKETGIKVITDYYSSNEEMYAKIKAGGDGYDITVPSTDYAEIMMKQGMLEKIDKSKISNLKELDESIAQKISFDTNHDYIIPYSVGATGIAVNAKYVKNFERSFDIYNREDLKGKMTLLDDMREVMSSALIIAGHSPESSNPQDLEDAQQIILGWKKKYLKI